MRRQAQPETEAMTETALHNFSFVLGPEELLTDEVVDRLYEVCDDALVGGRNGQAYIEFDREAPSLAEALIPALRDLERQTDLRVLRVEPDELVSLSAIAARTARTVESVRLLCEGKRGPGGFPEPIAHVDAKTRLWDWPSVAEWWAKNVAGDDLLLHGAHFLATLNDVLDARARKQHLAPSEKQAIAELAGVALAV